MTEACLEAPCRSPTACEVFGYCRERNRDDGVTTPGKIKVRRECVALGHRYCHAAKDGDCFHKDCPQIRDGEPELTGRHCPMDYFHTDE